MGVSEGQGISLNPLPLAQLCRNLEFPPCPGIGPLSIIRVFAFPITMIKGKTDATPHPDSFSAEVANDWDSCASSADSSHSPTRRNANTHAACRGSRRHSRTEPVRY